MNLVSQEASQSDLTFIEALAHPLTCLAIAHWFIVMNKAGKSRGKSIRFDVQ